MSGHTFKVGDRLHWKDDPILVFRLTAVVLDTVYYEYEDIRNSLTGEALTGDRSVAYMLTHASPAEDQS